MGISRPPDPYGLTDPPAWPEVDEDALQRSADAFDEVSKTLGAQLDSTQQERVQMFGGVGIWSGGGATAACTSLDKRIADLESVKEKLDAAATLFKNSVTAVVGAKNQIIHNVELATKILDWIRDHPDIPGDAKESAIRAGVDAIRAENCAIVASAGSDISGKPAETTAEPPRGDMALVHGGDPRQGPIVVPASNGGDPFGTTTPLDTPPVEGGAAPPLPQTNTGMPADPAAGEDTPPQPEETFPPPRATNSGLPAAPTDPVDTPNSPLFPGPTPPPQTCLLYTSDAADE